MLCNASNNTNPHAVFGANGSGKTILLRVLDKIQQMMNIPVDGYRPFIPYVPVQEHSISKVNLSFLYENLEYKYEIQSRYFDVSKIVSERLEVDKVLLERKDKKYSVSFSNKVIAEGEIEGELYSAIRKIGIEEYSDDSPLDLLKKAFIYLSSITYIDVRGNVSGKITQNNSIRSLMVKESVKVNKLLKKYKDFPVYNLKLNEEDDSINKKLLFRREGTEVFLPEFLMSNGMKSHSKILTTILSMKEGCLLVIDELERSLHPFVARQFIEELNENFNIHLIFASHNTNLLQSLRPDQIFFSKWSEKKEQSVYDKLSDTYPSIREINNIEKMYYGGLLDD